MSGDASGPYFSSNSSSLYCASGRSDSTSASAVSPPAFVCPCPLRIAQPALKGTSFTSVCEKDALEPIGAVPSSQYRPSTITARASPSWNAPESRNASPSGVGSTPILPRNHRRSSSEICMTFAALAIRRSSSGMGVAFRRGSSGCCGCPPDAPDQSPPCDVVMGVSPMVLALSRVCGSVGGGTRQLRFARPFAGCSPPASRVLMMSLAAPKSTRKFFDFSRKLQLTGMHGVLKSIVTYTMPRLRLRSRGR